MGPPMKPNMLAMLTMRPRDLLTSWRKAKVTDTVPKKLTSKIFLKSSVVVASTGLISSATPALVITPHSTEIIDGYIVMINWMAFKNKIILYKSNDLFTVHG